MIGSNNLENIHSTTAISAAQLVGGAAINPVAVSVETQRPGDRSGMSLASTNGFATAIPYTFCLPVLSGVIGVNASKMMPVGKLNAGLNEPLVAGTAGVGVVGNGPN